jgi:sugar phosphate isomerase/epimerase
MATITQGITRAEMLAEVEAAIDQAAKLQDQLDRMREQVRKFELLRDAAIRHAALLGAERKRLASRLGIARSTLYVAIAQPDTDDASLWEWLAECDDIAQERWAANDNQGEPDDYWPTV